MHTLSIQHSTKHAFESLVGDLRRRLLDAPLVDVGEWQAKAQAAGEARAQTAELEDVSLHIDTPADPIYWSNIVGPNLPWADEHFDERVGGLPLNPPPSHERWPYAKQSNEEHRADGKFSHTYPERFWPRFAGSDSARQGIRFRYGDVSDLLCLLDERRGTRQAYLPIWFPEDLAAAYGNHRVPCTLGYHLMIRDGLLNVRYFMRSCDFLRHFRDDVYLAGRLAQWVCRAIGDVQPGKLVMHISSLHVFAPNDLHILAYHEKKQR